MKNWNKLAMTAGAIAAIGAAGSFGTFSAFTDSGSKDIPVSSGTLKIQNDFSLPSLENLGTRETKWNCDGDTGLPIVGGTKECFAGTDQNAGRISVKNVGTLPQDVYIDFDGPGVADVSSPNVENSNPLASNIIINSSLDADFAHLGWAGIRLFKLNAAGPWPVFTLQPNEEKTVYFQAHLRERFPGEYAAGDNAMQNLTIPNEKVTVSAIDAGQTDLATGPDAGA
jgi:hypothetical protein